jgi:fucose permease
VTRPAGEKPARSILLPSYGSFILIGWTGLLVPSLLRVLQADFARTDAEFGLIYLVSALLFAVGALGSGLIAGRVGRRVVLPVAALLIGCGLLVEAAAPAWPIFVAGAAIAGLGCGGIDSVGSSVIMDVYAAGSGSALNLLHLFYSVGALAAPLVVGVLVGGGIEWRLLVAATGVAGLALAVPLVRVGSVPPRGRATMSAPTDGSARSVSSALRLALVALAVAIACYVAAESGVSSWLVGFLAREPMTAATIALGLFWAGIAGGRLVASRVADRFDPVRFTAACALTGGIAILVAVAVPYGPIRIALFLAAGFAFGPVYPMILAIAGSLFPHRAAAVAGIVAAAGVGGSITYPALMGLIAGVAGLGAGMIGAALLVFASGGAVILAGRVAGSSSTADREPEPVPAAGAG